MQNDNQPVQQNETPAQELARLRAENASLKEAQHNDDKLTIKISEKGCISVYGFGRFPVSLYRKAWQTMIDVKALEQVQAFINNNKELLDQLDVNFAASKAVKKVSSTAA